MADPLLIPALVGTVGNECSTLLQAVIKSAISAYRYVDQCKELADRLEKIQPIVSKIEQRASKTKHAECYEWLENFLVILAQAKALTNECIEESRLDKTKRMLTFWHWKKLPTLLTKINTKIDKATSYANLYVYDKLQAMDDDVRTIKSVVLSMNAAVPAKDSGEFLGFAKQDTPSIIVGVEEHFNELKTSILQSYGRIDEPSTFGLQGRGGAGKTLFAQMLNNDHDIKATYGEDSIVWITVGLDASVGDLYDRMGKCSILERGVSNKLKLLHNKEDQRMLLIDAFSKKKVLLILDDVWKMEYDDHDMMYWLDVAKAPGSATLITTRSERVLRRARAEVNVVLCLGEDDSWKLFSSHAFVNEVASLATIPEGLGRAICNECKGLPLALKVIGCTMMEKTSIEEWECALSDLQQSTPISDSNVDVELFGRLQLSYKELKNDATRICFLYFAAFPEDHMIEVEKLINIWVGEELFGPDLDIKVAKKKAYGHLRVLATRSLIDWNEGEKYAHIHDILRDLALYIIDNAKVCECAYECLFHSEKPSISFPSPERISALKRMSFMNCNIYEWPEVLQVYCPKMKVCLFSNTTVMQSGSFLDFLKNMVNLRVLDLSKNSFISEGEVLSNTNFVRFTKFTLLQCNSFSKLSKSLSTLKYVMELDLSRCGSLKRLPKRIGNLECLTKLNLFECVSLRGLPKSIGNLKCLFELNLSGCSSLTGLPKSIKNLKCLTKLDLSGCESLTGLPKSIGNLKCLSELCLQECGSLTELPESIGNLKSLTKLYLLECGSLAELPESIGNLKCLLMLNFSYCRSLTGFPESISNLKCLTKLDLSYCKSLTGLPESIGNLKCLTELCLFRCESLMGLPESIGNLKCLTELDLSYCRSLMGLPKSIGNLKSLTKLELSYCRSLMGLPESIGNLKSLTKLYLLECGSLTGLPESIGNLKCLTVLYLRESGSLTGLPESIGNLKCLTKLYLLECTSLTGLPESIGNLKCLIVLFLRESGSLMGLPESIGNLKCLTHLNLRECGSLMELPESIGNLKCLTELDLSYCRSLIGLPESIGNLKCLTKLDLSYCRSLLGLRESIGNLKCLTKLCLFRCESLTGLPESINNLKCLTELDLSYCKSLTGSQRASAI